MGSRALAGVVCVVLLAGGCGGSEQQTPPPPAPRLTPQVARALDRALDTERANTGIPGISAAVVFPDGREWSGAVGDAVIKPARPMTPDTALPFDSITKIATATLALKLAEQGKLRLDDPIERWYPAWDGDPKATVRDLLGHTSGARDPDDAFYKRLLRGRPLTARDAIAATPKPGPRTTGVHYSNTGFLITGLILERAAGEPLATALRAQVLGPGLVFQPTEKTAAPRAHQYWYPHGGADAVDASDGGPVMPFRGFAAIAWSAGSLAGTVPALARWAHALLGGHVLEPASMREMTRFHSGQGWPGYGLGLASDSAAGVELWGHTGDGIGSHTELWHAPREDLTVAASWNDDALDRDPVFLRSLLRAALG